jgi:hypothetical protein
MIKPQIGDIAKSRYVTAVLRHADGQAGIRRLPFACTVLSDAREWN